MAQHDYNIANATFPNTRSDINNALSAVASNNSGTAAPSTTFANQWFYETDTNLLQIRNEDNDAYITIAELDQSNDTVEYFKSDSIRTALIEFTDGDDAITIADGGGCTFPIASTFTAGFTSNDGCEITTADNTDQLTLTSTDTDASAGARLRIYRNSSSPADSDFTGDIRFESKNDAAQDFIAAQMLTQSIDVSDGTEDGKLTFKTMKAGTLTDSFHITPTEAVLNDDSVDRDFRVETDANAVAFKIDAGNNVAGFNSTDTSAQVKIENQNASGGRSGINVQHPSSTDTGVHLLCRSTRSSSLNAFFFGNYESNSGADNEFLFRGDGNAFCDGAFSGGGADYAEYFEWKDGNSSDEDRVGYSVVLDGNKIVKATDSDDASKIIGVISVNPAVVGDGDILRWKQKFLLYDFGREVTEEITVTEWKGEYTEEDGTLQKNHIYSYDTDRIPNDVTVPSDAEVKSVDDNGNKLLRRKTNPDWNESETYISREDRKEWDTVGLMGKLRLRKGQPTGTNWIKMKDISDMVEEWLVR